MQDAASTDELALPISGAPPALSRAGRGAILAAAFLGWMFAGVVMVFTPLAGRSANLSFLGTGREAEIGLWISRQICAFLLGAAAGGLLFGWLGDRIGRAKSMGLSILCYSAVMGLAYFARSPAELMGMQFIACLGVGGMWPNGIALASEAWSNVSRPLLAGLIGTSANLGFVLLALLAFVRPITPGDWRWVLLVAAGPSLLGLAVLLFVPESPRWLARGRTGAQQSSSPMIEVFCPPMLKYTLVGILLGMIPLLGNWGGANWLVPWASKVGGADDPYLQAWTQGTRSGGAAVGALVGGWLASLLGRRTTYFLISLGALCSSAFVYWTMTPLDTRFLPWVFVLGFFGTVYFGWLPLYLPELFPTRVRATGAGVSFNFGRVATAVAVLGVGQLMLYFDGDYARIGQVTCLIYILGMVVILFAPDTSQRQLED
jgi:MFS family permease